jgi:hypothetical protein
VVSSSGSPQHALRLDRLPRTANCALECVRARIRLGVSCLERTPSLDRLRSQSPALDSPKHADTREKSGRLDLNQRPFGPQPNALPDCATPRGGRRRLRGTAYVGSSYAEAGDGNRTRDGSLEGSSVTNYTTPAPVPSIGSPPRLAIELTPVRCRVQGLPAPCQNGPRCVDDDSSRTRPRTW